MTIRITLKCEGITPGFFNCHQVLVCGPMDTVEEARAFARHPSNGWAQVDGKDLCRTCKSRPQNELPLPKVRAL